MGNFERIIQMKFCNRCGSQIDDNAIFCPRCGYRINGDTVNGGYNRQGGYYYAPFTPAADHTPSKGIAVLSFFFWQVGLIIWLVCRHTKPGKSRSALKGMLASFCLSAPVLGLVYWILWSKSDRRDIAKVCGICAIVGASALVLLVLTAGILHYCGVTLPMWLVGSEAAESGIFDIFGV